MNIKVGDLVMVTKAQPCCGTASDMGYTFKAGGIERCLLECRFCGHRSMGNLVSADSDTGHGFNSKRLIKIDPPALPETIESENEVSV